MRGAGVELSLPSGARGCDYHLSMSKLRRDAPPVRDDSDDADDLQLVRRTKLFERVERATEVPMLILAVVFLLAVGLPEVMDLSAEWLVALEDVTWIVWAAFAFELVVKTYL